MWLAFCAGNPVTTGLVGAVTEVLRVLGVGKEQYKRVVSIPLSKPPVPEGDVPELVARIASDFENNYFITGKRCRIRCASCDGCDGS